MEENTSTDVGDSGGEAATSEVVEKVENKYAEDENYKLFLSKNVNPKVAEKLVDLCATLSLTNNDFDERAVELLASFLPDQGLFILSQLEESKMFGVQNKPQYLMALMKNFRDRVRQLGSDEALTLPLVPGPKPEDVQPILERTGYQLEVTVGQRKYHANDGPVSDGNGNCDDENNRDTADNEAKSISSGHQDAACIYVGQIPKDVYEDVLVPLFEEIGPIQDLRIMMDPLNGKSRGYAFLIYKQKDHANVAAKKFDGYEIQPGKTLKVNVSVANTRLFIGNIPKSKSKEEILEELRKHAEGVEDVIVYPSVETGDMRKNRGFCFVDFVDHKTASDAKRRISMGKIRLWNTDLVVDWAEQQEEPNEEIMATVKVLYLRNLRENVTEPQLQVIFEKHGEIEKVKKIRDYAFVHFKERESALAAMEALNGSTVDDIQLDISLAKPQGDMKQKKKIAMKRGGAFGMRGGRGFGGPPGYGGGDFYGGRGRNGGAGYKSFGGPMGGPVGGYPPPVPYDPYGGYGMPYGGYDPYGPYGYPPDPYYGNSSFGPGPSVGGRGGGGGRSRGGGGGGGGRGGARGRGRGSKRPSGDTVGPASKRGGTDFASDFSMNMF